MGMTEKLFYIQQTFTTMQPAKTVKFLKFCLYDAVS